MKQEASVARNTMQNTVKSVRDVSNLAQHSGQVTDPILTTTAAAAAVATRVAQVVSPWVINFANKMHALMYELGR